jgi:DeoR family transcriptional regulator, glycerol-3-phosphate regulon repressor
MIANSIEPSAMCSRNAQTKDRIGACVAGLVADGALLFLDTGEACAHALVSRWNLRAVSYSLRIAASLSEAADFTVAVPRGFVRQIVGGVFQKGFQSFISCFKFEMAIRPGPGMDDEGDLVDDDQAEVATVRSVMTRLRKVLLAVDGSKYGLLGRLFVDLLVPSAAPTAAVTAAARRGEIAFLPAR